MQVSQREPFLLEGEILPSPHLSWHSMKQLLSVDLLLLDQIRQKSVLKLMASVQLRCSSGSKSLNSLQTQTTTTYAICRCIMKMIGGEMIDSIKQMVPIIIFLGKKKEKTRTNRILSMIAVVTWTFCSSLDNIHLCSFVLLDVIVIWHSTHHDRNPCRLEIWCNTFPLP